MKAKVYYQNFAINAHIICESRAILIPDKAVLVREIEDCDTLVESRLGLFSDRSLISNGDRSGVIWDEMNQMDISPEHPSRSVFEKAGHTSMSVGDYIEFDDGEIWIALPMGWDIRNNSEVRQ